MAAAVTQVFTDGGGASDAMPITPRVVLLVALVGSGTLLVWIGGRSIRGTLPRNWVAGIRTTATLRSDAAWDAAHATAGRGLIVAGVGSAVAGAAFALPLSNGVGLVVALAATVWLLGWVVAAGVKADRAARRVSTE